MEREMTVERYDPARELTSLRDAIGGLFDEFFAGRLPARGMARESSQGWIPAVDIYETDDEIRLSVALPGVEKDAIGLEVRDGALVISGTRKQPEGGGGWLRRELPAGPFYRAFGLPAEVRADAISAEHKDGILELRLPKAENAKPHKVQIR